LASVGNITFLGCTVVSTITWRVSAGFMAPVLTAMLRLSCSSTMIRSSPMRWRHRVIEERSKGNSWQKNSSPHRYWKYGFSTQRAHSSSSDRLNVCFRIARPAISRVGSGGIPGLSE
jgi:arylamine N-acetyltransferase